MDYQKDIQKNEGIVKFVENQATKTNPFGDNRVGERAYRRAERIGAAIFLLTLHVSDTEPLRIKARSVSLQLIEAVLGMRAEMRSSNSEKIAQLKVCARELISLVRMLAVAGSVSFQNASVITEALDELSGFIFASQRSNLSESASFSKEDFLDIRDQHLVSNKISVPESYDNVRNDTKIEKVKDTHEDQNTKTESKGQEKTRLNSRTQAILEVLRAGGEVGIRDVASQLPEFSEKMIQRELAALVDRGLVKKSGEKRWSRYALVAR